MELSGVLGQIQFNQNFISKYYDSLLQIHLIVCDQLKSDRKDFAPNSKFADYLETVCLLVTIDCNVHKIYEKSDIIKDPRFYTLLNEVTTGLNEHVTGVTLGDGAVTPGGIAGCTCNFHCKNLNRILSEMSEMVSRPQVKDDSSLFSRLAYKLYSLIY